jgi:uncharacterized damage-inducible protein DinB
MGEQHSASAMLADLRESQQALLAVLDTADPSLLYAHPDPEGWTLAEVLVHIAEARTFFAAETAKVIETPGASMGRTIDHPDRLRNVAENGQNPPGLIRQKLIASDQRVADLLATLSDAQLQITGQHVKYGTQTLGHFIHHFLIEHDQAHVRQAQALARSEVTP